MNQLDYVISYSFQLHLIFHACVRIFDMMGTVEIFLGTPYRLTVLRKN